MNKQATEQISRLGSPLRLFVTLMLAIFSIEFIVMFILPMLPISGRMAENLTDSSLLTLLSSPIVWILIVRPLRNAAIKIADKTRQLIEAQEELVHKEKLAMLGMIAGSMGNELRNPLGVMNNAVYFLKMVMPVADETVREYLEIIGNEIDNSHRIISDLTDFCRVRAPRAEPVAVHELIRQCREKCTIPENFKFQTDLSETLPKILADPRQMGQVFQNLIANAVQAMPSGGALRIAARLVGAGLVPAHEQGGQPQELPLQTNENFLEISVTDTGEGISPENMEKIFQPLFTTKSRGIGLGLAISQKLTEANGGRIEVESEPGKGTTFTMLLPINGEKYE